MPDPPVQIKTSKWNYAGTGSTPLDASNTRVCVRSPIDSERGGEPSWYHQHLSVAKYFMCNSVRPGTQATYGTGERRWFVVAELIETDRLMRVIPHAWVYRTDELRMSSMTWSESCMLAFLASCRDAGQQVAPQTAFGYLSAVKKFLQVNGVDVKFFENSQYIKNTKAGMMLSYRMTMNRDEHDSKRMSVSIGMIQDYDAYLRSSLPHYGVVQMASYVAQLLGYTTLSRVSEYLLISDDDAEHLLVSECILFELRSGRLVPSCEILDWDLTQVTGCVIDILSAKNDPEHKGHRMYFGMADLADPQQSYCITTALWTFAKAIFPVRGRSFFYIQSLDWTLRPPHFNKGLKAMATYFQLDPARVSSHSLRIGGASALAAAGVPDYIIMNMGRWKSLAFLTYVRRSAQMFERARYALSRRDLLPLENMRLMHPRCSTG